MTLRGWIRKCSIVAACLVSFNFPPRAALRDRAPVAFRVRPPCIRRSSCSRSRTATGLVSAGRDSSRCRTSTRSRSIARPSRTSPSPSTSQNSATQYVGTWTGSTANTVRDDCDPSASCGSLQDNIARQARNAGLAPRSYVEGATKTCSASGNAAKHIPRSTSRAAPITRTATPKYSRTRHSTRTVLPTSRLSPPQPMQRRHDLLVHPVGRWAAANVQPVDSEGSQGWTG